MSTKRIVILTSRDNFVWTSMQEIIPMIEQLWNDLCLKNGIELKIINVDSDPLTAHLPSLITADAFVVTCFNTKIAKSIKILRQKLQIDAKIIFYLHGLATIGLWPLHRFEVLHLFNNNDIFIGTCNGDLHSMRLSLKHATTAKVPFTLLDNTIIESSNCHLRPFVFIGRISPQKNIDQLILAYSQLHTDIRDKHSLIIFGAEDHLGYPNLGIKEHHYLAQLLKLRSDLNMESSISFRGFVDRLEIQKELGSHYIFVSPSTHSDENFGMAAFRALLSGAHCVLTAWGGHNEFPYYFDSQIEFINPTITTSRTGVNVDELKNALEIAAKKRESKPIQLPNDLKAINIQKKLLSLFNKPSEKKISLCPTELAENIFKQQKDFEDRGQIQQCFDSFEDPAMIKFFEAYSRHLT